MPGYLYLYLYTETGSDRGFSLFVAVSWRVYGSRACAERLRSTALAAKEHPEWSRSERKQLRPRRPLYAARGQ